MSIALEGLQQDGYRLGDLQALRYEHTKHPFYDGYLGVLYEFCKESRITNTIFGGNPIGTSDAITAYLSNRPVVVMGEWTDSHFQNGDGPLTFRPAGFAFPVIACGAQKPELAMFCGYGFFRHIWGKPELPVLAMLGLAYLFQEFGLKSIHGTRFEDNVLTARFMRQFGMRDIGRIPDYQLRDGVLVPAVVSTLARADFEQYVEEFLVAQYRATVQSEPVPEPQPQPVQEKPKEEPMQASLSWL